MRHIRRYLIALAALAFTSPALAQSPVDPNVKAEDIPKQPLRDLNIDKQDVPPLLIDIAADPYATAGLQACEDIERGIADIDAMLGTDIDDPDERSDLQKGVNSAGRIAGSIVGGLIPFRGVVREVSGARAEASRLRVMINAAMVRRGFLKGIGLARSCPWPARPAVDVEGSASGSADLPAFPESGAYRRDAAESAKPSAAPAFVSRPVVQKTD